MARDMSVFGCSYRHQCGGVILFVMKAVRTRRELGTSLASVDVSGMSCRSEDYSGVGRFLRRRMLIMGKRVGIRY